MNSIAPRRQFFTIKKQTRVINECMMRNAAPILKVKGNSNSIPPIPKNNDSNCMLSRGMCAWLYITHASGFFMPPNALYMEATKLIRINIATIMLIIFC